MGNIFKDVIYKFIKFLRNFLVLLRKITRKILGLGISLCFVVALDISSSFLRSIVSKNCFQVSQKEIMTKESNISDEEPGKPVISIQSDWDDVIFTTRQEVWISCKFLGREGVHSKLQSDGKKLPICLSDDFSVLSLSHGAIKIKHNSSGQVYAFVPPQKTFSKVHQKKITSLNVAESGLGVSVCTENQLRVWDLVTGEVVKTLDGHIGEVYKCRFFPSGVVVLSAGADMQLKIWSAESGDCPVTMIGHKSRINDFCVVERGRNIISVSRDGTAKLWDCGKSACLATVFESSDALNSCSLGLLPENMIPNKVEPDNEREIGTNNKLLVIGSEEGHVYGISVYNRKTLFTINTGSAVNLVLALSDQIVIGCQNGSIKIYKLSDVNVPCKVYNESSSPVLCGCAYKDSGFFIGRGDGSVIYYDCQKILDKRISLTGSDCDPISDISCLNNKVFTSCRDGKIRQYVLGDLASNVY